MANIVFVWVLLSGVRRARRNEEFETPDPVTHDIGSWLTRDYTGPTQWWCKCQRVGLL